MLVTVFQIAVNLWLELGPCHVNSTFDDYINPHSWNQVSNLLFLSQPLGVGMASSALPYCGLPILTMFCP